MMTPFEFRPIPLARTAEIWARDTRLGAVTYDKTRCEWLAEADGESRHCASFGMALSYIEAVLETGDWLALRFPSAVTLAGRAARPNGAIKRAIRTAMRPRCATSFIEEPPVFYYVLPAALEPEMRLYAACLSKQVSRFIRRDGDGKVVVGFSDQDRASLFLNLFENEIERAFKAPDALTAL
jgi:hypothetical protein